MARTMRNKPVGWRYESTRHSLAARGIPTGRRYNVLGGIIGRAASEAAQQAAQRAAAEAAQQAATRAAAEAAQQAATRAASEAAQQMATRAATEAAQSAATRFASSAASRFAGEASQAAASRFAGEASQAAATRFAGEASQAASLRVADLASMEAAQRGIQELAPVAVTRWVPGVSEEVAAATFARGVGDVAPDAARWIPIEQLGAKLHSVSAATDSVFLDEFGRMARSSDGVLVDAAGNPLTIGGAFRRFDGSLVDKYGKVVGAELRTTTSSAGKAAVTKDVAAVAKATGVSTEAVEEAAARAGYGADEYAKIIRYGDVMDPMRERYVAEILNIEHGGDKWIPKSFHWYDRASANLQVSRAMNTKEFKLAKDAIARRLAVEGGQMTPEEFARLAKALDNNMDPYLRTAFKLDPRTSNALSKRILSSVDDMAADMKALGKLDLKAMKVPLTTGQVVGRAAMIGGGTALVGGATLWGIGKLTSKSGGGGGGGGGGGDVPTTPITDPNAPRPPELPDGGKIPVYTYKDLPPGMIPEGTYWRDIDADGVVDPNEIFPLGEGGAKGGWTSYVGPALGAAALGGLVIYGLRSGRGSDEEEKRRRAREEAYVASVNRQLAQKEMAMAKKEIALAKARRELSDAGL